MKNLAASPRTIHTPGRTMLLFLVQTFGYATYQASAYTGLIQRELLRQSGLGAHNVWFCLLLLMGATGLGCLAFRALYIKGTQLVVPRAGAICAAALVAITLLESLPEVSGFGMCLLSIGVGLATSAPLLLWFESFLFTYRLYGPSICMASISCGTLLGFAPAYLTIRLVNNQAAVVTLAVVGVLVSAVLQWAFFRLSPRVEKGRVTKTAGTHGRYRLSVYVCALVASFGAVTGLANGTSYFIQSAYGAPSGLPAIAQALACILLITLSLRASKGATLHFGLLIRMSLVFAGISFAFAPTLNTSSPLILACLCQAVTAVQGVAMTLLSVEICHERNLEIVDVMPANYAVYVVCVVDGMAMSGLCANSSSVTVDIAFALAVTSVVAVIPALPASSSSAARFTSNVLLENERYEDRTKRVCAETAQQYGLSTREQDVLGLLLQGLTRAQIAERLSLSGWTVKEYTSSIYAKVGVHSAKGLMVRFMAQAGSPNEE